MANRGRTAAGWRFLATIAAIVAFLPVALWWLRLLGLVPDATPFAGIEYLPPSWLLVAIVPAVGLLAFARFPTTAGVLVFAWFAVALFRGDHALGSRSEPAAAGGADVGLLEWNVAGSEPVAIATRLSSVRADVAILSGGGPGFAAALAGHLAPWRVLDGGSGGTVIVTPHPVIAWRTVELPAEASPDGERRRVLHAELQVAGTRLHALAVNLADAEPLELRERLTLGGLRLAARDAGSRFLSDYIGRLAGPVIVGGELDAPPASAAVRRLAGVADDVLLADHPVGLLTLGTWREPIRSDYLFVRDLAPVRSERIEQIPTGAAGLFGVARLPGKSGSFASPASSAVPFEG